MTDQDDAALTALIAQERSTLFTTSNDYKDTETIRGRFAQACPWLSAHSIERMVEVFCDELEAALRRRRPEGPTDQPLISQAMAALESDATDEQRYDAWNALRDRFFPVEVAAPALEPPHERMVRVPGEDMLAPGPVPHLYAQPSVDAEYRGPTDHVKDVLCESLMRTVATQAGPSDASALRQTLVNARLAVNDWHACASQEELQRWREAQRRLIDAAFALGQATAAHKQKRQRYLAKRAARRHP